MITLRLVGTRASCLPISRSSFSSFCNRKILENPLMLSTLFSDIVSEGMAACNIKISFYHLAWMQLEAAQRKIFRGSFSPKEKNPRNWCWKNLHVMNKFANIMEISRFLKKAGAETDSRKCWTSEQLNVLINEDLLHLIFSLIWRVFRWEVRTPSGCVAPRHDEFKKNLIKIFQRFFTVLQLLNY